MKLKRNGVTRIVILIGNYAIKIPNFTYCHRHWLQGCCANWTERDVTKSFRKMADDISLPEIAPTLFCSWFGLISIQLRAEEKREDLTVDECFKFRELTKDIKKENFGYLNGNLVCIDYA